MNDKLKIGILGLGEAGSHFANDLANLGVNVIGFDPKIIRASAIVLVEVTEVEMFGIAADVDAGIRDWPAGGVHDST